MLRASIETADLERVYTEIELPLVEILFEMERMGVRIDTAALDKAGGEMEREIARLTGEIYGLAGQRVQHKSPVQLGEIFERLNFEVGAQDEDRADIDHGRRARRARRKVRAAAAHHRVPRACQAQEHVRRRAPEAHRSRTGRVHTTLNQAVTSTGRLSSTNPNLQNIPIRSEPGRRIRAAFVPSPGCLLMSADYSQVELRIFAHITGDPVMTEAFKNGEDIHARTARAVFGATDKKENGFAAAREDSQLRHRL